MLSRLGLVQSGTIPKSQPGDSCACVTRRHRTRLRRWAKQSMSWRRRGAMGRPSSTGKVVLDAVSVRVVPDGQERAQWDRLMDRHHWLSLSVRRGRRHVAETADGRWLALPGWTCGAFKVKARDEWIGWALAGSAGVPPACPCSGPVARCGVESTTGAVASDRWSRCCRRLSPVAGASVHAMARFPVAARRTARAALPHPALSASMPSPTAGRASSLPGRPSAARCRAAHRGSGTAPCRRPCASCATTGAADAVREHPRCALHG